MKVYRVSELVCPVKYRSLAMIAAGYEGTKIHSLLAEKYAKIRGNHIETTQVCWLTSKVNLPLTPILGWVIGHPDRWFVEGTTLRVIDWKTIGKKEEPRVKYSWWWDQLVSYTFQILTNHPSLKIKKIILEIWVFNRQDKEEDTIATHTLFSQPIPFSVRTFKANTAAWLLAKMNVAPDLLLVASE